MQSTSARPSYVAMVQSSTNRAQHPANSLRHLFDVFQLGSLCRRCTSTLVGENGSSQASTANESALLAGYGHVVTYHDDLDGVLGVGDGVCFLG